MAKANVPLRMRMIEQDYDQAGLARITGRSESYIGERMRGQAPWSADDMDLIGTALEIPREKYAHYFVPEGCGKSRTARRRAS